MSDSRSRAGNDNKKVERSRKRKREKGGCIVVYCIVLHFVQCGPFILGKPISMNIVEPMQYPMRIARAWWLKEGGKEGVGVSTRRE